MKWAACIMMRGKLVMVGSNSSGFGDTNDAPAFATMSVRVSYILKTVVKQALI